MAEIGTNVQFQIGAKTFVGELSNSVTHASNTIDVSSKASGRATNSEYGRKTVSASASSNYDPASSDYGYRDAVDAQDAKTKVVLNIGTSFTASSVVEQGTALLTNVNLDNPDDDKSTFSVDFQFDGNTAEVTL